MLALFNAFIAGFVSFGAMDVFSKGNTGLGLLLVFVTILNGLMAYYNYKRDRNGEIL
jgi:hypothetical protein